MIQIPLTSTMLLSSWMLPRGLGFRYYLLQKVVSSAHTIRPWASNRSPALAACQRWQQRWRGWNLSQHWNEWLDDWMTGWLGWVVMMMMMMLLLLLLFAPFLMMIMKSFMMMTTLMTFFKIIWTSLNRWGLNSDDEIFLNPRYWLDKCLDFVYMIFQSVQVLRAEGASA